jgi:hypothetical protein
MQLHLAHNYTYSSSDMFAYLPELQGIESARRLDAVLGGKTGRTAAAKEVWMPLCMSLFAKICDQLNDRHRMRRAMFGMAEPGLCQPCEGQVDSHRPPVSDRSSSPRIACAAPATPPKAWGDPQNPSIGRDLMPQPVALPPTASSKHRLAEASSASAATLCGEYALLLCTLSEIGHGVALFSASLPLLGLQRT